MIVIVAGSILLVHATDDAFARKDERGRAAIAQLSAKYAAASSETQRHELAHEIAEIRSAIENNHRPSIPAYVDFIEAPIRLADALNNPIAKGKHPATNLPPNSGNFDLSGLDPVTSTFWQRPAAIQSADLRVGFDRAELPNYDCLWSYAGPKKAGRNGGCVLECDGRRIKVKFGETHSEPFNSRIFHALGYNVDPTDYSSGLKLKYDRRFFLEFNSRRPMIMRAGMFFLPLCRINLQAKYDPFEFIDRAVLKSRESLSGAELKSILLRNPKHKHAELQLGAFREDVENQIDYLITKPANVQIETPHTHNIGPWDFSANGHKDLRELRGAGLLAAWLGWWDSRFENTRVRLVKTENGKAIKHFWTDLGGGLGAAGGTFRHSCEKPGDFGWSFTRVVSSHGQPRFEIDGYEPVEDTPAFAEMTIDDARWMARLIGQLTEHQIVEALAASGFAPSDLRVYTEKLLARRDKMIRDLQLTSEIALLRPDGPRSGAPAVAPKLLSKSR